ncbi:hypothetical protein PybrP1_010421 [[Pythium] brassicae (nom. inval.)]|nr:hypothetical protein PybrP1_010421 [[Pythium] brassicae (nom. inval.)]
MASIGDDPGSDRTATQSVSIRMRSNRSRGAARALEFCTNAELATRVALGVLLAGIAQTRAPSASSPDGHRRAWLFLPDHYFLGGLTYAAVMVVYAGARTVGGVLEQMWQIDVGVALALLFDFVVFATIPMTQAHLVAAPANLLRNGSTYSISLRDLAVVVPLLLLFTFVVLVSPTQSNIKKFAVSTSLYFTLTLMNPMNPIYPNQLKPQNDALFGTKNLMTNFAIYSIVGAVGTMIGLATVLLPTPILATRQLKAHIKDAPHDIRDVLNLIVDSYCFRAKDIKSMDFFRLRLDRLLAVARARLDAMERLLGDCGWEELLGVWLCDRFNKTVAKQFVKLYSRLLQNLHALKFAIEAETSPWTHVVLVRKLQKRIYVLQTETNDLLEEISDHVLRAETNMSSPRFATLERKLEIFMAKYATLYSDVAASEVHAAADVGRTMPLHLFLYSFHALAHSLIDFQHQFNRKNFSARYRVRSFLRAVGASFCERGNYPRTLLLFSLRTTLAVLLGVGVSTFAFAFSSTVPTAIAMVAQVHMGGSYSSTANRLTGLVAGSVLPSIFSFFLCRLESDVLYNTLNNLVLFVWTAGSMYVYFSGSYLRVAGVVSAFIAASVLLQHECRNASTSVNILSYSALTENALGILILLLVELTLQPASATTLLRTSIQGLLAQYSDVFRKVFRHHIASERLGATGDPSGRPPSTLPLSVEMLRQNQGKRLDEQERKALRLLVSTTLPQVLAEQTQLLQDAALEPALWRPKFSADKYARVLVECRSLLARLCVLLDLVEWREKRRAEGADTLLQRPLASTLNAECCAAAASAAETAGPDESSDAPLPSPPPHQAVGAPEGTPRSADWSRPLPSASSALRTWLLSQSAFESSVEDSLETLSQLFGADFLHSSGDESALFLQMIEAFRLADTHRRGEVDARDLTLLLERLLPYSAIGTVNAEQFIEEFMRTVDKNGDGKVSFAEFKRALDEGVRFELVIYDTAAVVNGGAISSGGASRAPSTAPLAALDVITPDVNQLGGARAVGAQGIASALPLKAPSPGSPRRRRTSLERSGDALLNVESFSVRQTATALKQSYAELFVVRYSQLQQQENAVSMDDVIVTSCLISTCEEIAASLSLLSALAAT